VPKASTPTFQAYRQKVNKEGERGRERKRKKETEKERERI
jgi:hypothetical protein